MILSEFSTFYYQKNVKKARISVNIGKCDFPIYTTFSFVDIPIFKSHNSLSTDELRLSCTTFSLEPT